MADWWEGLGDVAYNLGGAGDAAGSAYTGGTFNLGDLGGNDWWSGGQFNLGDLAGGNWWDSGNFNLGGLDTNLFAGGGDIGGGGGWWDAVNAKKIDPWMNVVGKAGVIGKTGFDVYNTIEHQKQMADYTNAVQDYYKKQGEFTKQQQDYLKAKQAWEQGFMEQFGGAQEEFGAGMAEYQGQLAEASAHAEEVMGQYLASAKPLLAQSQELLVPGVAALARGETPEAWQPLLNEARNRGVTAMVQSMVAAGMSPEEARAAAQPVAEQQAQTMLLQLATQMTGQGGELAKIGMGGLAGAGGLTEVMGKLAAMGMDAESQEFKIMASVLGSILGQPVQGTTMPTPPPPVG